MSQPVALTIAGSDPTGGAGIQADLKTFAAHNVYGASIISVLTAQNGQRFETRVVEPDFIVLQAETLFEALEIQAIKIGMLADEATVRAVIKVLGDHNPDRRIPVILDPVIRASNRGKALDDGGIELLRHELLPLCTLVKPNLFEAAHLLGQPQAADHDEMKKQARQLLAIGCDHVLLSGGHLPGSQALDVLASPGGSRDYLAQKADVGEVHGTGCTFSAAITANLALGHLIAPSVELAKTYLTNLINQEKQQSRIGKNLSLDHFSSNSHTKKT